MKKNKQKAVVKELKKLAKAEIAKQVIEALKPIASRFGNSPKKMEKLISKYAKRLAKKLSTETLAKPIATNQKVDLTPPARITAKIVRKPTVKKEETSV